MYRDELTQASQKIDELNAQLDAQHVALAMLKQQVTKRLGPTPGPSAPRRALALVGAACGGAVIATLVSWLAFGRTTQEREIRSDVVAARADGSEDPSTVRDAPSFVAPAPRPPPAPPPAPDKPNRRVRSQGADPGFRLQVADEARVAQLAGLCQRREKRTSLDALPRGTRHIDFLTCSACDCCEPDGAFPPSFDEHHKYVPSSGECHRCSQVRTLEQVGVSVDGGSDDEPLRSTQGLIFRLARPARVFGLDLTGTAYELTKVWKPDHRVSLVAFDQNGRPIDAALATYPSTTPSDEGLPDFNRLRRVLVVEACEGEAISRVDMASDDQNISVKVIALQPGD